MIRLFYGGTGSHEQSSSPSVDYEDLMNTSQPASETLDEVRVIQVYIMCSNNRVKQDIAVPEVEYSSTPVKHIPHNEVDKATWRKFLALE